MAGAAAAQPREADVQAKILQALHEVAIAAGGVFDPVALAQLAIDHARNLVGAASASMYWWEEDQMVLRRLATHNPHKVGRKDVSTIRAGEGAAGRAFDLQAAVVVPDYLTWKHAINGLNDDNYLSVIAIPMVIQDVAVGAISVGDSAVRQFSESDVAILTLLAAQVAPAIQAARLVRERDRQAHSFAVLHEIAVAASGVLALDELATLTVDLTRDLVGGWSSTLVWFGPGDELRVLADNHPEVFPSVALAPGRGMSGQVALTGEMIVVDEYESWAHAFPWAVAGGVRSMIGVPLKVLDATVGCLLVRADRPHFFTAEHQEMLPLLAAQVAPTIQAAHLSAERERQALLFRSLHDLAVAASGVLDPAELARVAVERCRDLLQVDGTVLFVFDELAGQLFPLHEAAEDHLVESRLVPGEGAIGVAFSERRVVAVDDYTDWDGRMNSSVKRGLASGLAFPLLAADRAVGSLGVWSNRPRHWTQTDIQIVSLVAAQIAPAIQSAQMAKERSAQAETLAVLHEIAIVAHGVLQPVELAALVVDRARDLLGTDSAVIHWWDEEAGVLRALGENHPRLRTGQIDPKEIGATGQAFRERRPVVIDDYQAFPAAAARARKLGVRSVLAVPLLLQDRTVGAIAVRSDTPRRFQARDIQLLSLLAAGVAPPLEAARLNAELIDSEKRFRTIFDTAPLVIARCDLKGRPLEVNRASVALFGYTEEEVKGMAQVDLIDAIDPGNRDRYLKLVGGELDRFDIDQAYRRRDGSRFWGHTTISLVRDAEGRPDYFYAIIEDVTERRLAAEAIQAQADTFRALHDVATAAAGVLEPTELARIAVERACALLGVDQAGLSWWETDLDAFRVLADTSGSFQPGQLVPSEKGGAALSAFRTGEVVVVEDYPAFATEAGRKSERAMSVVAVPLKVRQVPVAVLVAASSVPREFTADDLQRLALLAAEVGPSLEAARLHSELVASERSVRAIFETAPMGIARLSLDRRLIDMNRRMEELTGYSAADLAGDISAIRWRLHPSPPRRWLHELGEKRLVSFERRLLRKDESEFDAQLTLSMVRDAAGNPDFIYAMVEDITERKAAEAALLQSEGRKRAIVESALDCIVASDRKGRISEFNPAAEKLFGRTRQEVTGRLVWDVISPERLREQHELIYTGNAVASSGRRFETVGRRADGVEFPIELSIGVYEVGGSPMVSTSIRDLSERQRAETARLESEAKSRFVASMSHELRTPLNSILGFSQLLASHGTGPLNERQSRYVGHIETSGRHLLALINDVLDLSKVAAGQMAVEMEPIEIQPMIEEALSQLRPQADAKPLDLIADAGPPIWVRADRRRLLQVLLNLLSNAVKFTPAGGLVRVRAVRAGKHAEISVIDTGVGIPGDQVERIFDEFTQVGGGPQDSAEGTGLGLTLSRRLLQLMHGSIAVESHVGQGSTFTVTLPRVPPGEVAGARPLLLVVHGGGADERILTRLESGPYRVIATGTAREAAIIARRRRLSAIVVGDSIPPADGDWLREALRDHPRTSALPIMSAAAALHPGVLIGG